MADLVKSFIRATVPTETGGVYGGQGNANIPVTANSANSGRDARNVNLTFTSGSISHTRTVIQKGAALNASFDNITFTVGKDGDSLIVTGKSNAAKLVFTVGQGTEGFITSIPAQYTADGKVTENSAAIQGDPGATVKYNFSLSFGNIPANKTIAVKSRTIIVTPYKPDENNLGEYIAGTPVSCTIEQAAGDPYLTVGQPSGELNADGTGSITIAVTSNTSWTVA